MSQLSDEGPVTPTFRKDYDNEFDNDDHHQLFQRKSVLAKVKEKARRWRQRLARKKQGNEDEEPTPAWGVSLEEEEDDDEWDEQEYHGAPMYQSEMAPKTYKPTITTTSPEETIKTTEPQKQSTTSAEETIKSVEPPRQSTSSSEETIHSIEPPKQWPLNPFDDEEDMQMVTAPPEENPLPAAPIERTSSIKWMADAVSSVLLTPAYNIVSGATYMISSRIQGQPVTEDETMTEEVCDKGVSVKEYLREKLEPGDGEKALSEVITEAITPRKAAQRQCEEGGGAVEVVKREVVATSENEERVTLTSEVIAKSVEREDVGVVERVRGVVSSLIWRKEVPGPALAVSTKS